MCDVWDEEMAMYLSLLMCLCAYVLKRTYVLMGKRVALARKTLEVTLLHLKRTT